jgi:hypothetical protein
MAKLAYLVTEGQHLIEDAQQQRFDDYGARCESWNQKVQQTLFQQSLSWRPLALTRFKQAQPINTPQSGIPNSITNDFALLRGRLAMLTQIVQEAEQARRNAIYSWVTAIIGIIGVLAIIKGWFVDAFLIVKGWFP